MTNGIPANYFVDAIPSTLAAGNGAQPLSGLYLTQNAMVPYQTTPISFASADAVEEYFGGSSDEYSAAVSYFGGFSGATAVPQAMLFARYAEEAIAGYIQGGDVSSLLDGVSTPQLSTLKGSLIISVGGTSYNAAVDLTSLTPVNFSTACTEIESALTTAGAPTGTTVTFNSISGGFVITAPAGSSVGYATGTLAADLGLDSSSALFVSAPVENADDPVSRVTAIAGNNQAWVSLSTIWEPTTAEKLAFCKWASSTNGRYFYVHWDSETPATTDTDTSSVRYQANKLGYTGVVSIYPDLQTAAGCMGSVASIDYTASNGRTTLAYRQFTGVAVSVTDQTTATNLENNGYNYYCTAANGAGDWTFFWPGQMLGSTGFIDSYVNALWISTSIQTCEMNLLTEVGSIPYSAAGDAMIESGLSDFFSAGANFGAWRSGVALSASQKIAVKQQAGTDISSTLMSQGYYFQSNAASASAAIRAKRGSPNVFFWYMDGESVQRLNIASVTVQ